MNFKDVGKITYCNDCTQIGKYFKISDENFKNIKETISLYLNGVKFEDVLNDFFYHIYLIDDKVGMYRKQNSYVLKIYYSYNITWEFNLYYHEAEPAQSPIEFYEKEIIKVDKIAQL